MVTTNDISLMKQYKDNGIIVQEFDSTIDQFKCIHPPLVSHDQVIGICNIIGQKVLDGIIYNNNASIRISTCNSVSNILVSIVSNNKQIEIAISTEYILHMDPISTDTRHTMASIPLSDNSIKILNTVGVLESHIYPILEMLVAPIPEYLDQDSLINFVHSTIIVISSAHGNSVCSSY